MRFIELFLEELEREVDAFELPEAPLGLGLFPAAEKVCVDCVEAGNHSRANVKHGTANASMFVLKRGQWQQGTAQHNRKPARRGVR